MELVRTEELVYSFNRYDDEGNVISKSNAIDHLNISIEDGSCVAILGRNGSGKSTFAKHMNALLLASEGSVWIYGVDPTKEKDLLNIRKQIGMIFQNPDNQIISNVVEEDVAFGPENLGVPENELESRVKESLDKVGMLEFARRSPNKLSGGQKQRVAIAGVVAMKPKVIVMDEATAMLDPNGRKEVTDALFKLHREEGISLIMITHHMEEAAAADKIYIMDKGKLVMSGTPAEIFSKQGEVEKYGLTLPDTVKLRNLLIERGIPMPEKIAFTEEELASQLAELWKGDAV